MIRVLSRAAWLLVFAVLITVPLKHAQGQDSVRIEHNFKVPDTSYRVSPMLPLVSEYLPNSDYDQWWHEIAECEGLWLPPGYVRVRFFQINAVHFYDRDHPSLFWKNGELWVHWAIGQSFVAEWTMFVALPYRADENVLKHEMLHFLIAWNRIDPGKDAHPMPFYGRCGMSVEYQRPPK